MLAPSKRRVSFYTLPIVVVIGFLSVAGLAAWQRSEAIADLADQVAHGEKSEATAAVRQLAAIPNPPISILVEAAASDEHATAEAAQVAINRMLGQWQRQVDKKQHLSSVATQVTELAAALASQRQAFPAADYPWLSGATRKILHVANKCPAKKTPLVSLHCDEIISVCGSETSKATPIASRTESANDGDKKEAAAPAALNSPESRQAQLEREFSEFPSKSATGGLKSDTQAPAGDGAPRSKSSEQASGDPALRESRLPTTPIGQSPPDNSGARPDWSQPMFRVAPGTTTAATAASDKPAAGVGTKPQADAASDESAETRALIERWWEASVGQRMEIEEDLASRGFRRLPMRIVKQYLSDSLAERMRIVDTVLTEPGVDARPWLLLLADDENADVRLLAVTVMATSDDKSLVEAAWQVAVRDHDPRIADLAGRLRGRR